MTIGRIPSVEGGIQPTIVDAKGDLIAAVAADSVNRLAVGSNDQVLVADSSASTGLAWKSYGAQVAAGKNAVINGAMDFWQRGTSFTGTLGNVYGPDRWLINPTTARTFSRQSSGLTGIQYSLRCARNSSSTDTGAIYAIYSMESADSYRFAGQTVTLSYWAKAGANYSSASSALTINWQSGTGTDQNIYTAGYTGSATVLNTSVTLTTSWQRFTHTFSVGSTATEIGGWFTYTPTGTAGANDWFEVTGVQLEVGSAATPFSRAGGTIQGELAACQRYYIRLNGEAANATHSTGIAFGTTGASCAYQLPVSMRVYPTAIEYSALRLTENVNAYNVTNLTLSTDKGTLTCINCTATVASGLTQFRSYILGGVSAPNYVAFSAEL